MAVAGTFGLYFECVRPGRVLPGIAGLAFLIVGGRALRAHHPTHTGLFALAIAAVLFVADATVETHSALGAVAILTMVFGALRLLPAPCNVGPVGAAAASLLFGAVSMRFAYLARRARRNKQLDL